MTRIGRNTATLLAFAAVDGVLGWVQLKWLALHWGASGMGTFAVLFSAGGVLMLFYHLGLPLLVTRWVASREGAGRHAEAARVTLVALGWCLAAGALSTLAVFLLPAGSRTFWAPLLPAARALPWAMFYFAACAARQILYAVWNGRRRMELSSSLDALQIVAVTARLFVGRPLDLEGFFRWNALTTAVVMLVAMVLLVPGLWKHSRGAPPLSSDRELPGYAFWSGMTSVTALGFDYIDRLALASYLSAADVSYFHVPAKWLQFLRRLMAQPLQALFPELARGSLADRRGALGAFVELYSYLGLLAGVALALSPAAFIRLLATPEFDRGIPVLRILALVPPLMGIYAPLTTALRAEGSMRQGAVSDFLWVGTYLFSGALLIGPFGPSGLAMGQVLASLVSLVWNLEASRRRGWLALPAGGVMRQWLLAAAAFFLMSRCGWGPASFGTGLVGTAIFALAWRLTGGLSGASRRELHPRLPGPLRPWAAALLG